MKNKTRKKEESSGNLDVFTYYIKISFRCSAVGFFLEMVHIKTSSGGLFAMLWELKSPVIWWQLGISLFCGVVQMWWGHF